MRIVKEVGVVMHYLSKYGLVSTECETERLRIIVQNVLDTVIQFLILWKISCD